MDCFPGVSARLLLYCLLLTSLKVSFGREYYWTFQVKAGRQECFYQTLEPGQEAEIEYQVLEGGDLDIDFKFTSPSGAILASDQHRQDGAHTIPAKEKGDHSLCFDNTFSTMTDKLIFLDLGFDRDDDELARAEESAPKDEGSSEEISSIQSTLSKVHEALGTIIDIQAHMRAREARHRHTADSNNERVFWWSLLECGAMVTVGGIQVFMLRRLFGSHSKTTA